MCPVTWLPVDALVPAKRLARAAAGDFLSSSSSGFSPSRPEAGNATTMAAEEEEEKNSTSSCAFPFLGLALEVDGPSHDLRGPDGGPGVPTGGTALKRRLLAAAGWSVVVVGHEEWREAGSGVAAREHAFEEARRGRCCVVIFICSCI